MDNKLKINKLKKIFKKIFPKQKIDNFLKLNIKNVKNWDSLRNLNLILETEKEFKLKFNSSEFYKITSIKDLLNRIK